MKRPGSAGGEILRKAAVYIFLLCLIFLSGSDTLKALDVPALSGRVNDYAGMISPAARRSIGAELERFEAKESTQIVILTVLRLTGTRWRIFQSVWRSVGR